MALKDLVKDLFELLYGLFIGLLNMFIPLLVVSGFIYMFIFFIKSIRDDRREHRKNSCSPLISRNAIIIGKRQKVSGGENSTSTWYYITFKFDDGSREEFSVSGQKYGILVEGDEGKLHSQGTWFKGFERQF